ncbi:hypothetical protein ACVWYH_005853 [Bradyrhizobium sp. GM24.11]
MRKPVIFAVVALLAASIGGAFANDVAPSVQGTSTSGALAMDNLKQKIEAIGYDLRTLAIMEGAVDRVRPKMMTVVAIMAGLLPIMWSTGTGSEIMQRIAVPMIGGMVSSTLLTVVVIPAIFGLVKGFRLPPEEIKGQSSESTMATVPKIRVLERNG